MSAFTLDQLKVIVGEASGVTDGVTLDDSIIDVPLRDLGYDSLAVLEVASRIQRDFNLTIDDDAIEGMKTARAIIDFVNSTVPTAA